MVYHDRHRATVSPDRKAEERTAAHTLRRQQSLAFLASSPDATAGLIAAPWAVLAVSMLLACSVELAAFFLSMTLVATWMLRRERRRGSRRWEIRCPRTARSSERRWSVRTVLNIIWLLLCGIWMALGYVVAGVICCVLIVTIPFGIASFRIANYALWPFGRSVVKRASSGAPSVIGNIVWIIFAGWWLAIGHVLTAIALAVTIIGIPLAIANLKLIPVSLVPLGREIVDSDDVTTHRSQPSPLR
jgi:uncharacterized membrane protein YccF (DUF307 family)